MTEQLSRERLEKIASWREKFGADHNVMLPAEEAEAMARMLLAGLDSKPVAKVETVGVCWYADNGVPRKPAVGEKLYAAPPAPVADDYFASLVTQARARADKAMRKFPQPNYVLNKVAEDSGEVL